jgi:Uma2 family endonuclease
MNQVTRPKLPLMTTAEFLSWPGDGARNHELVDGQVRPMPPASVIHAIIQANLAFLLGSVIRKNRLPLNVGVEAAIVPALNASQNVRVPDLVVAQFNERDGAQVVSDPLLIIEILSPGNGKDTRNNVACYSTLASMQEIAIVHSQRPFVEIQRRDATGAWLPDPETVGVGETVRLASAGLECLLDEIYSGTWSLRK